MRELIFRGQRTDNNEWVYGPIIPSRKIDYDSGNEIDCFLIRGSGVFSYVDYEVYTTTLGQYTGVNDNNDKPIYEGDIILAIADGEMIHEGVVIFKKGAFYVDVPDFDCFPLHNYLDGVKQRNVKYELKIIGNIYDNQEWLEENR